MYNYDLVTCRRVNYIQAAMVQAALSIQKIHGAAAATLVLREERLPQDVIERVLAIGGRKRQHPYTAFERPASLLPDEPPAGPVPG